MNNGSIVGEQESDVIDRDKLLHLISQENTNMVEVLV